MCSKEVDMALKRLLLGICGVVVFFANSALAQFQPTEANQDGIIVSDALGRFFSAPLSGTGIGPYLFKELEANSQKLGFVSPILKDLELIGNPDGTAKGAYVVDVYGGQFGLTIRESSGPASSILVSSPAQVGSNHPRFNSPVFFGFDVVKDLEVAPDWRDTTFGFKGYLLLDADGIVHTLGNANLPKYVYFPDVNTTDISQAAITETLFPETIDVSGSNITTSQLLNNGPLNIPMNRLYFNQNVRSVTPVFTYFGTGSDIARDLEVSSEFVQLTVPSRQVPGEIENRTIAMTNGYYIMDGYGGVHSSRLPLDFDVNNDGQVLYTDMYIDFAAGTLNPDFGRPINNVVLAPDWVEDPDSLPYFGVDVAVDVEITPSGKGFYLLDAFGGIFAVGDATFSFPPKIVNGVEVQTTSTTPFFGFPIARDLALVPNKPNPSLGLEGNRVSVGFLVIDGFGTVHKAGLAENYSISSRGNQGRPISAFSDSFRSVEITPLWLPGAPPVKNFVVGMQTIPKSVAPGFRNVTAAFSSVSSPQ